VQCLDCGLRYVNPQPSDRELHNFYADFDHESTWRGDGEEAFDRAICNFVCCFRRHGSVLDIGSSRGNSLIAMRRSGFSVYGIEPSPQNSEFARAVHGISTYTGSVEQFLSAPTRREFDIITVLNVLEHLRDPKRVLLGLRELLVDGGLIVIVVPDARLHALIGQTRRKLGFSDPFWMNPESHPLVGIDPPQHLCSFEPRTIELLVRCCGFQTLALRNAPVMVNQATWKNVAKKVLHACSEVLYFASFRRLVLGYSTLIAAQKVS
jgi:SAM-dependent methyltransferase